MGGEFIKGTIYSETKIADSIGISRTPLRDALQKISHEGLIDIMPSKGFFLHQLTRKDLFEICQLRCAIEGYSARLISSQLDTALAKKTICVLSDLLVRQRELNESNPVVLDLVEVDYKFHIQIVSYPQNETFMQLYSNNMYRMRMVTIEGQELEWRRKSSLAEHTELVKSINTGDGDAVYRSVLHHNQNMIEEIRMRSLTQSGRLVKG
jgi:DNA-binding GntR family transcriptional regulator